MNLYQRTMHTQKLFDEWHLSPHVWGSLDCAHMAARMAEIMTGNNPAKDWPAYESEQQAFKVIRGLGFKSLQDAVSSYATLLDGPLFAIAGDIVAIKGSKARMPALGVCLGPDAVLCFWSDLDDAGQIIPGTSKARRLDMQFAESAWRVA
jgi:hypothetical protein